MPIASHPIEFRWLVVAVISASLSKCADTPQSFTKGISFGIKYKEAGHMNAGRSCSAFFTGTCCVVFHIISQRGNELRILWLSNLLLMLIRNSKQVKIFCESMFCGCNWRKGNYGKELKVSCAG